MSYHPQRVANALAARRKKAPTLEERFWAKVDKRGPDECWNWLAYKTDRGYGRMGIGERVWQAHHISCIVHGLPLPTHKRGGEGNTVIDHICKNTSCVNPKHLRLVPHADNCTVLAKPTPFFTNIQKTHCVHGHPFSGANLAIISDNRGKPVRGCITCYPHYWSWAVEKRDPPPRAKVKAWRGPFVPKEKK